MLFGGELPSTANERLFKPTNKAQFMNLSNEVSGSSKISAFDGADGAAGVAKRLLSKRELAAILSVSERTIENWLAEKRIPRLRLSARLTRFSLPKVEAALNRYEIKEAGARR
jgi:excisionase family DNA binding protein